jgi:hypothetical protein
MPVEEYRRDFLPGLKETAAAEFDELLSKAVGVPIVPFVSGNSLEAVREDPTKRDEQYQAVGIFIARHCHVLLALWDGNERQAAIGGSAQIVKFKRDGIPLEITRSARQSLDAIEIGPVIHVLTPRLKNKETVTEVAICPWGRSITERYERNLYAHLRPVGVFAANLIGLPLRDIGEELPEKEKRLFEAWRTFSVLTGLTQKFNSEATSHKNSASAQKCLDELFWDHLSDCCDRGAQEYALEIAPHWCALYKTADTLAQRWQCRFRGAWRFLFAAGFIAFFFFEVYAHLIGPIDHFLKPFVNVSFVAFEPWFLFGYSALFLAVYVYFGFVRHQQHQERFLDYRALAEALRVAIFWKLAGVPKAATNSEVKIADGQALTPPIPSYADAYPIRQPNELAWVKTCLRTLELVDAASPSPLRDAPLNSSRRVWPQRLWVDGQARYFDKQRHSHSRKAEVWETRSLTIFAVSPFMVALVLLTLHWIGPLKQGADLHAFHDSLVFAAALLPGIAAVLLGYVEQLAFKAQARQYDRMSDLFSRASKLLRNLASTNKNITDDEKVQLALQIYAELGVEAMKENAEWVALYRQRPLRPPQG